LGILLIFHSFPVWLFSSIFVEDMEKNNNEGAKVMARVVSDNGKQGEETNDDNTD